MSLEDIKAKFEQLGKTVAEFQEANNKRLDEIQAKGQADPLTVEAVEKANAAIGELKGQIKALTSKSDDLETMLNRPRLAGGEKDAKNVRKNALEFYNAVNKSEHPIKKISDDQVAKYEQYREAFNTWLRNSPDSPEMQGQDIRASMSVGSNSDGGFWAPTEMVNDIVTKLFETSPMRSVADILTISAPDVEWPKDVNDATSGGWVGETSTRDDTATPQVGMQKVTAHEQYAQPKVTQKFLDDAAINVEAWLNGKIADKLSRDENTAFVSGDGVARPRGFLSYGTAAVTTADTTRSWGVLQYIPSGASGAFPLISGLVADDANPLITTVHKLKQAYRAGASWMMNRNVAGEIRKLRDANGRYLWNDSLILGQPDRLHGYQVVEAEDMPDFSSNAFSVAFGNFKLGYRIVDRIGIRILRDPLTSKPFVKFYTTKRVGGDVINFDAIKLLKMSAT